MLRDMVAAAMFAAVGVSVLIVFGVCAAGVLGRCFGRTMDDADLWQVFVSGAAAGAVSVMVGMCLVRGLGVLVFGWW